MHEITVERRITAPVEQVWKAFTDLETAAVHLSGVKKLELLSKGPFGVGTRWRETRGMFGLNATEEMEVTTSVPQHRYVVEARSRGVRYTSTFAFTPLGRSATLVRLSFGGVPEGLVTRLLGRVTGPLANRTVRKTLERDLGDMARFVER